MTEAENVSVDVLFEGVVLAQGVALRVGEVGLFAPMPAPMPVGTRLDLARGAGRRAVRVARVQETGEAGMFLVGEHGAKLDPAAFADLATEAKEEPPAVEAKVEEPVDEPEPPKAVLPVIGLHVDPPAVEAKEEAPPVVEAKVEEPVVEAKAEEPVVEAKVEAPPAVEVKAEEPVVEAKAEEPVVEAKVEAPAEAGVIEAHGDASESGMVETQGDSGGGNRRNTRKNRKNKGR